MAKNNKKHLFFIRKALSNKKNKVRVKYMYNAEISNDFEIDLFTVFSVNFNYIYYIVSLSFIIIVVS